MDIIYSIHNMLHPLCFSLLTNADICVADLGRVNLQLCQTYTVVYMQLLEYEKKKIEITPSTKFYVYTYHIHMCVCAQICILSYTFQQMINEFETRTHFPIFEYGSSTVMIWFLVCFFYTFFLLHSLHHNDFIYMVVIYIYKIAHQYFFTNSYKVNKLFELEIPKVHLLKSLLKVFIFNSIKINYIFLWIYKLVYYIYTT